VQTLFLPSLFEDKFNVVYDLLQIRFSVFIDQKNPHDGIMLFFNAFLQISKNAW